MQQINSLADALKGIEVPREHKPSLPAPKCTPAPQRGKVASNPTRQPINRQAAMILSPNRSWISQPLPPEKLPTPQDKEIERLKADLKTERNSHAGTRDELGELRNQLRHAKLLIGKQQNEIRQLKAEREEQAEAIRQLEDLKL